MFRFHVWEGVRYYVATQILILYTRRFGGSLFCDSPRISGMRTSSYSFLNITALYLSTSLFQVNPGSSICISQWKEPRLARPLSSAIAADTALFYSVGTPLFNLKKTWEKLLLAARIIVAIENPADICVISSRTVGQVCPHHTPAATTSQHVVVLRVQCVGLCVCVCVCGVTV